MTERPDGCYRWVIFDPDCKPEIAYWSAGAWHLRGDVDEDRVYKVGVGGTLDAPPDVWDDDLPVGVTTVTWRGDPEHGWSQSMRVDLSSYGTDDPDRTP